jgi:hypothetical protein
VPEAGEEGEEEEGDGVLEEFDRDLLQALGETLHEVLDGEWSRSAASSSPPPRAVIVCTHTPDCLAGCVACTASLAAHPPTRAPADVPAGGARTTTINTAPPGRLPWEVIDVEEEVPMVSRGSPLCACSCCCVGCVG